MFLFHRIFSFFYFLSSSSHYFHSESSPFILLASSRKLATSWRVFDLCALQTSMYDRPSRENYEESHRVAGKHHIGCPMRISIYSILLLVKFIFHPHQLALLFLFTLLGRYARVNCLFMYLSKMFLMLSNHKHLFNPIWNYIFS